MAFNISTFRSRGLVDGGARPSLFKVEFGRLPFATTNLERFSFLCQAASIPPAITQSIDVPYFGRTIKVAGDRVFPDWNVEVMNDEDYKVRAMMEKWSNEINSLISNVRSSAIGDPEEYKVDASVIHYSKQGDVLRKYTFVGLFPTTVDAMQLNWAAQNQIQTFGVNFAYDYWEPEIENSEDTYAQNINVSNATIG
jgi:hypothetical protein